VVRGQWSVVRKTEASGQWSGERVAQSYRQLIAWQKAMELVEEVYRVTRAFPSDERFGLTSQMRRCAVSIPSNIAEGHGRLTTKDFQHFLAQARGSLHELETQLMLAIRLTLTDSDDLKAVLAHAEEVGRILNGLLASTRERRDRKDFSDHRALALRHFLRFSDHCALAPGRLRRFS
jgi:four helix bundle protein